MSMIVQSAFVINLYCSLIFPFKHFFIWILFLLKSKPKHLWSSSFHQHPCLFFFFLTPYFFSFPFLPFFLVQTVIGQPRCLRDDVRLRSVRGPCSLSGPRPRPSPVRRDTSYQGGSRRAGDHLFSAPAAVPSIPPVWWILFSALLFWVIWGIIPKVSMDARQESSGQI